MALNSQQLTLVRSYIEVLETKNIDSIISAGDNITKLTTPQESSEEFSVIGQVAFAVKDYIQTHIKKGGTLPFEKWINSFNTLYKKRWTDIVRLYPTYEQLFFVLKVLTPALINAGTYEWIPTYIAPTINNPEYEITDVGHLGAILGPDAEVKPLGRTIRVLNLRNTDKLRNLPYTYRTNELEITRIDGVKEKIQDKLSPNIEVFFASKTGLVWPNADDTAQVLEQLTLLYNNGIHKALNQSTFNIPALNDGTVYSSVPFAPKVQVNASGSKYFITKEGKSYQTYKYRLDFLSLNILDQIESETNIAADFLYDLKCLWIEQENYPNQPALSYVPIFPTWPKNTNGQYLNVIDNVYKNSWNSSFVGTYSKFVFLVDDDVLNNLITYFNQVPTKNREFNPTRSTKVTPTVVSSLNTTRRTTAASLTPTVDLGPNAPNNPTQFLQNTGSASNYGQQITLQYEEARNNLDAYADTFAWLTNTLVPVLGERSVYNINPIVTDLNFAIDILTSQLFLQLWENFRFINTNIITDDTSYDILIKVINSSIDKIYQVNPPWKTINLKLLNLLIEYCNFVKIRGYLIIENVLINRDGYGVIDYFIPKGEFPAATNPFNGPPPLDNFVDIDIASEWVPTRVYAFKGITRAYDRIPEMFKYNTKGLFNCIGERINTFFTGSTSPSHSKYYIPVYNGVPKTKDAYHQFDISYAHISGAGSSFVVDGVDYNPAKSIYRKYLLECLGTNQGSFIFKNNKKVDYFYVIQFDRDSFKDRIDPGNIQITLAPISSSKNQLINTGSNFSMDVSSSINYTLIDDSGDANENHTVKNYIQDYYYLISGSIQEGPTDENNNEVWGMIFPRSGFIILDGTVLDQSCSFNTVTASIDGDNIRKLFISISGSCTPTINRQASGSWYARSCEEYRRETYLCRVNHNEFNYSNNYTYMLDKTGSLSYSKQLKPFSYITNVGLYNRTGDLVAVGKLKNPLRKTENDEYIFQVRVRLN